MAKARPYVFCRYQMLDEDDPVTPDEEFEMLERVKGEPIALFKSDPQPEDRDTFIMRPRRRDIDGHLVHTWGVARHISTRITTLYDRRADEPSDRLVETDEIQYTEFVAVPMLGIVAVGDHISERTLGAQSAIARFKAIVEELTEDWEVVIEFAGSPQEAQRALQSWRLDTFRFTGCPINPTPEKLGRTLHEAMKPDHVGRLTAPAKPAPCEEMQDSDHGFIAEVRGLAEEGYGQYGATGTTPSGLRAQISFDLDKEINKKNQARNRKLKVFIDKLRFREEEIPLVRAIVELYGT